MLAHDKARFSRVDLDFRNIASDIARDRRVLSLCRRAGLSPTLHNLLDQLGRCQKSLKDFLEVQNHSTTEEMCIDAYVLSQEKRSAFPRFYFIGDDDLLEILGQSTKQKVVQTHLKKLFAGIHNVQFDESGNSIIAMQSLEGEFVPLSSPVKVSLQVEVKRKLKLENYTYFFYGFVAMVGSVGHGNEKNATSWITEMPG
jgi:dynein heavy chain 2